MLLVLQSFVLSLSHFSNSVGAVELNFGGTLEELWRNSGGTFGTQTGTFGRGTLSDPLQRPHARRPRSSVATLVGCTFRLYGCTVGPCLDTLSTPGRWYGLWRHGVIAGGGGARSGAA